MSDKEITCNVLKVFKEQNTRRGKTRIHIIQWGKYAPVLEKREYWYDDEDQEKTGKLKGINSEDLKVILENTEEIEKLLEKKEEG